MPVFTVRRLRRRILLSRLQHRTHFEGSCYSCRLVTFLAHDRFKFESTKEKYDKEKGSNYLINIF